MFPFDGVIMTVMNYSECKDVGIKIDLGLNLTGLINYKELQWIKNSLMSLTKGSTKIKKMYLMKDKMYVTLNH